MKTPNLILSLATVGLGVAVTSCVDPYYSDGYSSGPSTHTQTTVTQYRPGYVTQSLPSRYETEMIGGTRYYRHENVYYRPQGNRYVVVEAPQGSRGWSDRGSYDRRDSRYGQSETTVRRDSRYDVMDGRGSYSRETRVIRTLPRGAREVSHRGTRYYTYENQYYRPQDDDSYIIVDSPF